MADKEVYTVCSVIKHLLFFSQDSDVGRMQNLVWATIHVKIYNDNDTTEFHTVLIIVRI
jgi:hypothetical protein